jgi:membrane-associated phospholipid phosphatase
MLISKINFHGTILFSFTIIVFGTTDNFTQEQTSETSSTKIPLHLQTSLNSISQNDFSIFVEDGLNLAASPFNFTSNDWLKTGAFVLATGLAFSLDPSIKDAVNQQQNSTLDNTTSFSEKYGRISYAGIFAGGMYLTGKIIGDNNISTTGRMLVESILYSSAVVSLMKYTVGRARPYANEGPSDAFEFHFNEDHFSFPSGHTAIAFTVSTVLSRRIDNPFATIALYGLAGFTGYQRIYDDKHWFSDVFVGAAIGYFIGNNIVDSEENRNYSNFLSNVSVMPAVSSRGAGLNLHVDF